MLKILLKKQFREQYAGLFFDIKKNKARSRASTIGMVILTVLLGIGVFGVLMTVLSIALCGPLTASGMGWLYFVVMGFLALLLGVVGGSFAAYTHLYKSKDNDTLLALPIPVQDILTARILSVYITTGGMSFLCILPALIVYWVTTGFSFGKLALGLVFALSLSLISLVLGCLLGYLVARISTKLKNKTIITVLSSLLIMGIYYFFYFRFQRLMEEMTNNPEAFRKLENIPLLKFFGQAGEGNGLPLLVIALTALLLFGLTLFLLVRSFRKIISMSNSVARVKYKEKKARQQTPFKALVMREFAHLTGSPGYMLNGALGSVFMIILSVIILIEGPNLMRILQNPLDGLPADMLVMLAALAVGFLSVTNTLTAPSVSLEGSRLWIVKSIPVKSESVLMAKLVMHWLVTGIPALIASLCLGLVMKPGLWGFLLLLLFPQLCILLFSSFGLMMGVLRPNLSWTNEMVPIKQSLPVMLTMFGGMFYGGILAALYFLAARNMAPLRYLLLVCVLTALLTTPILLWLRTGGKNRFEAL